MILIRNWSIKKKLTLITFFTSTAALILSSVGFLILARAASTRRTLQDT